MSTPLDTSTSDAHGLEEFAATIDRDAEVPIGLQLGWALCARIQEGEFRPGQRLPGLREMAQASGLNVNTVRAVYQRLEQRGLLESRQGSGTFVASTLPKPSAIGTIAADAAREAEAIGVDPREVAAALYVAMPAEQPGATATPASGHADAASASGAAQTPAQSVGAEADEAAARRRALRAQIATLERAIAEMEAEHPGVAPRSTATRRGPGPTLLSAAELEQVRGALVRRLAQVQSAIDERAASDATGLKATRKMGVNARARVNAQKDNTPTATDDADPAATKPTFPTRPTRPRSTSRPAAAGT